MPPPHSNWQQHEHSHQHKPPRQYQPSSYEYQHDHSHSRERGRRTSRSGSKKEREGIQREFQEMEYAREPTHSQRQRRNGSFPDLARLPPPEFRSLPHAHGETSRQHSHDRKQKEKSTSHHPTKGRISSTGTMRRSRTTTMTTPMEGVSRHQQTSSTAPEEDSQSRRTHHRSHGTPHYPTIPGDRVHFDTMEPYSNKIHQQLQDELKSHIGGRRRSRSVSVTSRERSLERNVKKERHHQHRKKEREPSITADRPISPPAQFSLPSTAYAAISPRVTTDSSAGRRLETQYLGNQKLPSSQFSKPVDTKSKGLKAIRPSPYPQSHDVMQTRSKSPVTTSKPSLQERYSSSFSSHQIPPPLPSQGTALAQQKAKLRAKDKIGKSTVEDEIDSTLSSHKHPQHYPNMEHLPMESEDSLKHVCGMDSTSLQFQIEPEESRAKVPVALKPQKMGKQRNYDVLTDIHGNVKRSVAEISEPRISESDSYMPEDKQKGVVRGKDKTKHIILPATNGEIKQQFAQSYERQNITYRVKQDDDIPEKEYNRDDRSKRRPRSKPIEDDDIIRPKLELEEEQKVIRDQEERDKRIARKILEKQKEAKAKAERNKLEQELERERLTAEMREKERIAKEMANQERKAIEKAERDRREKLKLAAKLQQERDEERRSQRSRMGRDTGTESRLARRLSKDVLSAAQSDATYVKGEYVDNIDLATETTRLLMPPEDDSKRERSWDRKSRKSYDSAPPLDDGRLTQTAYEDGVKRPSTMPDTKRHHTDSHKHKVIVHKDTSYRSGRGNEPDVFTNGIITHEQPSYLDETDGSSSRPKSLISDLPPPPLIIDESSKRSKRPTSPACICEHDNGGENGESDSGNQETVLEVPVPSHEFHRPDSPVRTHRRSEEIEPSMPWDRRSRESKGSRATKTSHSARSQGYASLASSVFVGEKIISKTETVFSRTEMYGPEDDMLSPVESVDLCITTDDHPSMITPSVLGDIITTDDGRGSPLHTQYRPRSHSKSRHHKSSSGSRERRASGHRDYHHQQQQRPHVSHQTTPKSHHRGYKHHHHHPEGSDLGYDSRCDMYGLESDYEIEQHIRNCRCPCDHMGHGNYLDYQVGKSVLSVEN